IKHASDNPDIDQVVALAERGVHRMDRMIRQLLDLTRARMGNGIALTRTVTDLDALVRGVADEVRLANEGCKLLLSSEPARNGYGDADGLEQVIQIRGGNAGRYGVRGSPVRVRLRGTGEEAFVSVHSVGPPIPSEIRSSLFELFRRGIDSENVTADGLGLG